MTTRFSHGILSAAAVLALVLPGAALAQGGQVDMSLPPTVVSQPVPADTGTSRDPLTGPQPFYDQPFDVNGTEVVCTGTGSDARADPRWRAYPLKLEFSGAGGQYLGEERVSITGNGVNVRVRCRGPWLLLKVPAGSYAVHAEAQNAGAKNITVNVTGRGQTRVVVSFPAAGGGVSPEAATNEGGEQAEGGY